MANAILHKSNATAGVIPAAAALTPRELSINTADGRLFTKTDAGTVQEFARQNKGMQFGNVADAGATVLDWYEEGTSTITLESSGGVFTTAPTYANRTMRWTRIGNTVHWSLYLNASGGAAPAGTLKLTGLPFTIFNSGGEFNYSPVGYCDFAAVAPLKMAAARYVDATTYVLVTYPTSGAAWTNASIANYTTAGGVVLSLSGTYRA